MYHTLIIVGNLGKDPEMKYMRNGDAVTSLSLATNRQYTKDGQKVKETVWFKVSVWGKQAESCANYLKKGSRVLVEGRLTPDISTGSPYIWTATDGTPRADYEVSANTVRFLSSKEGAGEGEQAEDEAVPF